MIDAIPIKALDHSYIPSIEAYNFHTSPARFRFLIWGVKSGKSHAGAYETCRAALDSPGEKRIWVVGPTQGHTDVAWAEVNNVLNAWRGVVLSRNLQKHQIRMVHGALIEFKTAERPDNLRGFNVDACWVDEGAYLKPESWNVLQTRVAATEGEIWVTTTPNGRNWIWPEIVRAGMPPEAPYGEFEGDDRWVSHYPSKHFPWASRKDIQEAKQNWPRAVFNREYGAMFTSSDSEVFRNVEECFSMKPRIFPENLNSRTVIGVDLARHQDFSAVVVMAPDGQVLYIDRWSDTGWNIQKPRLVRLAKEWNATLVLDTSNVGSYLEEELRREDVGLFPVNLHDQYLKQEIIQCLQVAFEHQYIEIIDPRKAWANSVHQALYDEIKIYQCTLTRGRRLSYSAPKGMHDDLVIALALANYGRMKRLAGGPDYTHEVLAPRPEFKPRIRNPMHAARKRMFNSVYRKNRSIVGLPTMSEPFFRR